MSGHSEFEVCAGSVRGRDHTQRGANNQDAIHWVQEDSALIAVVCDGCGSGMHSEVGAACGARALVRIIKLALQKECAFDAVLERATRELLESLRQLARSLGGVEVEIVQEYLLFSIVGLIITGDSYCLFSLGDGVQVENGRDKRIVFPNNAPPYLAYGLLPEGEGRFNLRVDSMSHTLGLESALIGSDGVAELFDCADAFLPGRSEKVGPIKQYWSEDRYFRNPFALSRRLTLVNTSRTKLDRSSASLVHSAGLLRDDTSIVAVRRKASRCATVIM